MLVFALFVLLYALPWLVASTFTFTSTAPTECDNLQISWTGGAGVGYYLYITPVYAVPANISIPASAYSSNGTGTFSTTLDFAADTQLVLTMSDSTGFGAGGSSTKLTVGKSLGGSCNTTSPALPYMFDMPIPLQQCQPYTFNNYIERGAVAPVTILGIIPGGDAFVLYPSANAKSFQWTADVFNGTEVIFAMVDANLRSGGSALYTAAPSSDSTCINNESPSSTVDPSKASSTSTSTSSPSTSDVPSTPRSSTGAIAGSVLGALIFLAVLVTLGLFFLRQRQEKKNQARTAAISQFRHTSRPMDSDLDLNYDPHRDESGTYPYMTPTPTSSVAMFNGRDPPPSLSGSGHPPSHYQPHSAYLSSRVAEGSLLAESENPFNPPSNPTDVDPFMERGGSSNLSAGQRKSMSGLTGYKPSRYVVHTDAEDDDLPANEDGVVELPPQYSASRGYKASQQPPSL